LRAIVCVISLLCAGSAFAQWVKYGELPGVISFFDTERVETQGSLRRVWVISDFAEPRPDGSRSALVQSEYDCADQTVRLLHFETFAQAMAKGENILSNRPEFLPGEWRAVPPNSLTAQLMNRLCAI